MLDLDELERLANAATRGPWEADNPPAKQDTIYPPGSSSPLGFTYAEGDTKFILAACNAIPELIARLRKLEAVATAARALALETDSHIWYDRINLILGISEIRRQDEEPAP